MKMEREIARALLDPAPSSRGRAGRILILALGAFVLAGAAWVWLRPSTPPQVIEQPKREESWPLAVKGMSIEFLGDEFREAVEHYSRGKNPRLEVKGIALLANRDNVYLVGIDVALQTGLRKTGHVVASVYTDNSGHSFWKIEGIDDTNRDLLNLFHAAAPNE